MRSSPEHSSFRKRGQSARFLVGELSYLPQSDQEGHGQIGPNHVGDHRPSDDCDEDDKRRKV